MRINPDQAKVFCERTGQMDKLNVLQQPTKMEKIVAREQPAKEFMVPKKYNDQLLRDQGIFARELPKAKYGNIPTEVNGKLFDSKKEANYYIQLLMQERCGLVRDIKLQEVYELQPAFKKDGKHIRAITYIADFVFWDIQAGCERIVDTKGIKTKEYRIKKKLFEYRYQDKTIIEV